MFQLPRNNLIEGPYKRNFASLLIPGQLFEWSTAHEPKNRGETSIRTRHLSIRCIRCIRNC